VTEKEPIVVEGLVEVFEEGREARVLLCDKVVAIQMVVGNPASVSFPDIGLRIDPAVVGLEFRVLRYDAVQRISDGTEREVLLLLRAGLMLELRVVRMLVQNRLTRIVLAQLGAYGFYPVFTDG
jgi:hypothetical protein